MTGVGEDLCCRDQYIQKLKPNSNSNVVHKPGVRLSEMPGQNVKNT